MLSQFSTVSAPSLRWSPAVDTHYAVDPSSYDPARVEWIAAFSSRLSALRPEEDACVVAGVAADLWADVGQCNPAIAAEMEHESWQWGE